MKKVVLAVLFAILFGSSVASAQSIVVKDSIVGNVTWTSDKTYLIQGFLYVVDGATLTIQPGTVIFGDKATKGTLIVERGGKVIAQGTATQPIVFTSALAPGSRASGDWGGIVLCGKAPINQNNSANGGTVAGGEVQIEGGPRSRYGGSDGHDNSGILSYVRIEYPGIALAPNSEINGLTMGGVGDFTQLDHIQVSYSGDDNFEWFGGTVNAKYLIGCYGVDDCWDTDFGWSGKVQFCFSLSDPNIADISSSNGFESDNDNPPNFWGPRTQAVFSNMTVVGPQKDTAAAVNSLFASGMHLRRNTQQCIYNSIVMGWPKGVLIDGAGTTASASNDTLQVRNCIVANIRPGKDFTTNSGNTFNTKQWFSTPSYANRAYVQSAEVMLKDPFNLKQPDPTPLPNSPALTGADFNNPKLGPLFTTTTYVGAFDPNGPRWDAGWSNYDPQNTVYAPILTANVTTVNFPNTATGKTKDSLVAIIKNTGRLPLTISTVQVTGNQFSTPNLTTPFTLAVGEVKSITIRFTSSDTNTSTGNIVFTSSDAQVAQVALSGKGVQPAPILGTDVDTRDFFLVRVNESATSTITITNKGTADLNVSNFTITGTDAQAFQIASGGGSSTILPTKTQVVTLKFTPTSTGDKTATLSFLHNAAGTTKSIALKGKGIVVPGQDVLKDSIVGNITLTNDRTWLVRGFVYIVNGATLTIEPGTVIMGEKSSKGTFIAERGGKIIADGTKDQPIIFTSQLEPGSRASGDWGGIVLCGKAPINQNNSANGGAFAGGDAQIEGGPRSHYGGVDARDNSGILRYVRIEFPGIALAPNSEINGLTMGGVGDGTIIDNVQVSYSGDDSYEWFGGTVNAKHLIALKGLDDDWDTDFGWSGKVQFGVSQRDPNIADISGSNGFESDNDNPPNYWGPRTSAAFSNMTVVGPQADTSAVFNSLFATGAHLRRNTQESIYNSIVMGFPQALLIDGAGTAASATGDTLQIRNSIFAGLRVGKDFRNASNTFGTKAWFTTTSYGNAALTQPADVKLASAFHATNPDYRPLDGSPALSGSDFTNARLTDAFFEKVSFKGAFGQGTRWDSAWSNYDPQTTVYAPKANFPRPTLTFAKTVVGKQLDSTFTAVITNTGTVVLKVTDISIVGSTDFEVVGLTAPFTIRARESKDITLRFKPTKTGVSSAKLHLVFADGSNEGPKDIDISGEAIASGVSQANTLSGLELFQNSPNPFEGKTSIGYVLPRAGEVTLEVMDMTGKQMLVIASGFMPAGAYTALLNSDKLANGAYVYRLRLGDETVTKSMIVVK